MGDEPLVKAKVTLGENYDDLPKDYEHNFNNAEADRIIESLSAYIAIFAKENAVTLKVESKGNGIEIVRDDGSHIDIKCFGQNIFDVTRWPSLAEVAETLNLGFDMAAGLNDDEMITLVRRFIVEMD